MRAGAVRDGLRLGFGTLSVVPVPAPGLVDRSAAAVAMSTAVLPGAVVGAVVGAVLAGLGGLGVPAAVAALVALGSGVLLTRFLHADGLADTADGLVASYDRDRALEVMRRGDVGPAGATTLVLVLGGQAAALSTLVLLPWWQALGGTVLAYASSRAVLPVLCVRGVVAARPGGLGAAVVGAVPRTVAALVPVLLGGLALLLVGPGGALAVAAAVAAASVLAWRAGRRLGGLTGDVLGAGVEVALLASLAVVAAT